MKPVIHIQTNFQVYIGLVDEAGNLSQREMIQGSLNQLTWADWNNAFEEIQKAKERWGQQQDASIPIPTEILKLAPVGIAGSDNGE